MQHVANGGVFFTRCAMLPGSASENNIKTLWIQTYSQYDNSSGLNSVSNQLSGAK